MVERFSIIRQEHGAKPPQQIKLYMGAEITSILLAMGLFIFPGLLSDGLAYLMLLPVFRDKVHEYVKWVQKANAQRTQESHERATG